MQRSKHAVIDFRIRPPYKDFLRTTMYQDAARRDRMTQAIGFTPSPAACTQSVDLLLQEMQAAGVDKGVVVGRRSDMLGSVPNAVIMELCEVYRDFFLPVGSLDPALWKTAPDEAKALVGQGFRALAIEPGGGITPLHMDDRRLYPLYAQCESLNVALIIMAGANVGPDISYSNPEHLDRVLADFPGLRIVGAHGGWPWVHQILHVALRRPNLYLSPDYLMANMPGMDDYVRAANGWLADRILYASAFPFAPVKGYLDWFLSLPISPENQERLLYKNAAQLLGL